MLGLTTSKDSTERACSEVLCGVGLNLAKGQIAFLLEGSHGERIVMVTKMLLLIAVLCQIEADRRVDDRRRGQKNQCTDHTTAQSQLINPD